jgi:hypothetical protein
MGERFSHQGVVEARTRQYGKGGNREETLMNRHTAVLSATLLATLLGTGLAIGAEKGGTGRAITLRGELVDSRCYLMKGMRGSEHVKCAVACAKDGLPIGLVDSAGKYYTLVIQASQIADSSGWEAEVEGIRKERGPRSSSPSR